MGEDVKGFGGEADESCNRVDNYSLRNIGACTEYGCVKGDMRIRENVDPNETQNERYYNTDGNTTG